LLDRNAAAVVSPGHHSGAGGGGGGCCGDVEPTNFVDVCGFGPTCPKNPIHSLLQPNPLSLFSDLIVWKRRNYFFISSDSSQVI